MLKLGATIASSCLALMLCIGCSSSKHLDEVPPPVTEESEAFFAFVPANEAADFASSLGFAGAISPSFTRRSISERASAVSATVTPAEIRELLDVIYDAPVKTTQVGNPELLRRGAVAVRFFSVDDGKAWKRYIIASPDRNDDEDYLTVNEWTSSEWYPTRMAGEGGPVTSSARGMAWSVVPFTPEVSAAWEKLLDLAESRREVSE